MTFSSISSSKIFNQTLKKVWVETFALSSSNCVNNLQHQSYIDFRNLLKLFNFVPFERRIERDGIRITTIGMSGMNFNIVRHKLTHHHRRAKHQRPELFITLMKFTFDLFLFFINRKLTEKNFQEEFELMIRKPCTTANCRPRFSEKKIQTKWIFMSEGNVNERCDKSQACYEFESVNCEASRSERKTLHFSSVSSSEQIYSVFLFSISNTSPLREPNYVHNN